MKNAIRTGIKPSCMGKKGSSPKTTSRWNLTREYECLTHTSSDQFTTHCTLSTSTDLSNLTYLWLIVYTAVILHTQVVLWEDATGEGGGDAIQTETGRCIPHSRERECSRRFLSLCQVCTSFCSLLQFSSTNLNYLLYLQLSITK